MVAPRGGVAQPGGALEPRAQGGVTPGSRPPWMAAVPATAASDGLQVQLEARDSWTGLPVVIEPTTGQGGGQATPVAVRYRGWVTARVGFNLALGCMRGWCY